MPTSPKHQRRSPWLTRSDSTIEKEYHTHKWRKYRERFLWLHPLCASCGQPANVVDHKTPARQRPDLFWRADNHQSMCTPCHNRKRATEDK